MGDSGCGVGRSVVRLPGLPAASPGGLELGSPFRHSSHRVPSVVVPRGEVLEGAVEAEGVVGLDPGGDQGEGRRVVGRLLPLPALLPEGPVVAFQGPVVLGDVLYWGTMGGPGRFFAVQ